MRSLRPTVIAVLALAMLTPATSWAGLSQIVAFGDSQIDTGNVFAATGNPPSPFSVAIATPCTPIARSTAPALSAGGSSDDESEYGDLVSSWAAAQKLGRKGLDGFRVRSALDRVHVARLPSSRPSRLPESDDKPGSGVTVRAEVLHLWMPETLIDLAGHQPLSSVVQTHDELPTSLERRGKEKLWYALTTRGHQVNGGIADITIIRHPYRDPQHVQEFLDVLATVAGNPPSYPTKHYSGAEVHVLPVEVSEREPSEVVEELLYLTRP